MSHRPVTKKRVARVRKALRQRIPAKIDLVQYLKLRGYAQTTGEALRLIADDRVKIDSHPVKTRAVPAEKRSAIVVLDA